MSAKRVLFLLDCLYENAGGGSERQFLKLYERAREIGVDPYVAFLRSDPAHQQYDWLRPPLELGLESFRQPNLLAVAWRLAKYVRERRIDVIHTLFDDATLFGGLVKLLCPRVRLVCSQRNLGHAHAGLRKALLARVFRRGDQVVVNARVIARVLESEYGVPAGRLRVIPNMYESADEQRAPVDVMQALRRRHGLLAITVANLRPIKGIDDLITAARQTGDLDLGYVIIGDGGGIEQYREKIERAGLSDRVHLLGHRPDVAACLRMADLAILPSRSEGLSNALVEYMFAGLPIIATAVGGNVEALGHGRYGRLVESHAPDQLAAAIRELAEDRGQRAYLGGVARAQAQGCYTPSRVSAAYRRLYQGL